MHRPTSFLLLGLVLLTAPLLGGCNKVRARVELKKGNAFYQQESYAKALPQFQRGIELDPAATFAWRSVGLTALALYRPGDASPQNREYEQTAIEAFEKYLEDYPNDSKIQEYLLTMYVNAKDYNKALAFIDQRLQNDPAEREQLEGMKINILTQAERLDEAAQLAMRAPAERRPEMLYSVGVSAWNKSYNDPSLSPEERDRVVETGLNAIEQALSVRPEYFEAMVYYNLLYREKAKMTEDPAKREEYTNLANEWVQKASELRKKQQAAAAPAAETT